MSKVINTVELSLAHQASSRMFGPIRGLTVPLDLLDPDGIHVVSFTIAQENNVRCQILCKVKDRVNVPQLTSSAASLTPGGSTITHATTRAGIGVSSFNNERMISIAGVDSAGNNLSAPVKTEVDAYIQASREITFIVHMIDPARVTINVTFSVHVITGFNEAMVVDDAEAAVADYLSPAKWGRDPRFSDTGSDNTWVETNTIYYNELIQLISNVEGVDRVVTLTYAIDPLTLGTATSLNLVGPAALTVPGAIIGSAV